MSKLAPCPYCGSKRDIYGVGCPCLFVICNDKKCHAEWPIRPTKKEAIEVANRGCWLPIEDAPKDGALVDLFTCDDSSPSRLTDCLWVFPYSEGGHGCWTDINRDRIKHPEKITHFMYRPEDPREMK